MGTSSSESSSGKSCVRMFLFHEAVERFKTYLWWTLVLYYSLTRIFVRSPVP